MAILNDSIIELAMQDIISVNCMKAIKYFFNTLCDTTNMANIWSLVYLWLVTIPKIKKILILKIIQVSYWMT